MRAVKRDIELLSQRVGTLATSEQFARDRSDLYCALYLLMAGAAAVASFVFAVVAASRAAT